MVPGGGRGCRHPDFPELRLAGNAVGDAGQEGIEITFAVQVTQGRVIAVVIAKFLRRFQESAVAVVGPHPVRPDVGDEDIKVAISVQIS